MGESMGKVPNSFGVFRSGLGARLLMRRAPRTRQGEGEGVRHPRGPDSGVPEPPAPSREAVSNTIVGVGSRVAGKRRGET